MVNARRTVLAAVLALGGLAPALPTPALAQNTDSSSGGMSQASGSRDSSGPSGATSAGATSGTTSQGAQSGTTSGGAASGASSATPTAGSANAGTTAGSSSATTTAGTSSFQTTMNPDGTIHEGWSLGTMRSGSSAADQGTSLAFGMPLWGGFPFGLSLWGGFPFSSSSSLSTWGSMTPLQSTTNPDGTIHEGWSRGMAPQSSTSASLPSISLSSDTTMFGGVRGCGQSRENMPAPAVAGLQHMMVTISDGAYTPSEATVTPGTAVVFLNRDTQSHTATAWDRFNSDILYPGQSCVAVFSTPGTYDYLSIVAADGGQLRGTLTVR
jgi:plastocyanin